MSMPLNVTKKKDDTIDYMRIDRYHGGVRYRFSTDTIGQYTSKIRIQRFETGNGRVRYLHNRASDIIASWHVHHSGAAEASLATDSTQKTTHHTRRIVILLETDKPSRSRSQNGRPALLYRGHHGQATTPTGHTIRDSKMNRLAASSGAAASQLKRRPGGEARSIAILRLRSS